MTRARDIPPPRHCPPSGPPGGMPRGGSPDMLAGASSRSTRGFSFIEVMIALSMLLVGCLAILPLFALGVQNLAERRVADDLRRVRSEVLVLAQQEVDRSGGSPTGLDAGRSKIYPLSLEGYDVRIEWIPSPFHESSTASITALAAVRRRGVVVYPFPPIALTRSTLDPASVSAPATSRR